MSKKCYRYFGLLLQKQENWLNKMAERGIVLLPLIKCYMSLKNAIRAV